MEEATLRVTTKHPQSMGCIALADDHPLFRRGLAEIVHATQPHHELAEVGSLDDLIALLRRRDDVVLVILDLRLPDANGLHGVRTVREQFPAFPLVVISALEEESVISGALALGAMGFIPKSARLATIDEALSTVLAGGTWTTPGVMAPPADPGAMLLARGLTPAQARVICELQRGLLNKQIAYEMGVTEFTVKAHMSAAFRKLGVSSRLQAIMVLRQELGGGA